MMVDDGQPILPYAGTSGWSGSDTSAERAARDDSSGVTSKRQRAAMALLGQAGERGVTWGELARVLDTHHGAASGVLSVLHRDGRVVRLQDRRGGSKIYVLPTYVASRATEPHGNNKRARAQGQALAMLHRFIEAGGADIDDLEALVTVLEGDR